MQKKQRCHFRCYFCLRDKVMRGILLQNLKESSYSGYLICVEFFFTLFPAILSRFELFKGMMLSLHIAGVLFLRLKLLIAIVCKNRDVVLSWKAQHRRYFCYLCTLLGIALVMHTIQVVFSSLSQFFTRKVYELPFS